MRGKDRKEILSLRSQLTKRLSEHMFLRLVEIVGLLLIIAVTTIFGWGMWKSATLHKQAQHDLQAMLDNYSDLLQFAAQFNRGNLTNLSAAFQHDILERYSPIASKHDIKADLLFLDGEGRLYLSNSINKSEEENNLIAQQWALIKPTKIVPNQVMAMISRGQEPALWLVYACKEAPIYKTLLRIRSANLTKSLAAEPMYNLLVHKDNWSLAPNGNHILDAIQQLPETMRYGNGFYAANKQLYYVLHSSLYIGDLYLYTVWNISLIVSMLIVISLTSGLLFILIYTMSRRNSGLLADEFTKDIELVQQAFNAAETGNLDYNLAIDSSLEMQAIGKGYQSMMTSLKRQMAENAELERIVTDEQIKQLGSQFTNHFLFNTLDNIYYMCRLAPDLAEQMVLNLAKLLRYNTHSPQEKVTLGEDIQYIRIYLDIVKIRFQESFAYEIEMADTLNDYVIPKLLIQPIVENALKYGRKSQALALLKIVVSKIADKIIITCHDNGSGMSEEMLAKIQNDLLQAENLTGHLGLYNVAKRIRLTYGSNYGLSLKNDNGLLVTVSIPALKEVD